MYLYKKAHILFVLFAVVLFTGCVRNIGSDGLTLKLDESELNSSTSKKFPIEKSFVIANVEIDKPNIFIKEEDRISASLDMVLNMVFLPTSKGSIEISGKPYFDKEKSAIFLKHVEVDELNFTNKEVSNIINKNLFSSLKPLVDEIFKTMPIYTIPKNSFRGSFVKDIKVQDKELLVTFGLWFYIQLYNLYTAHP